MVQAAVIPTRVLPAPQGNTMIPQRARLENIGKEWLAYEIQIGRGKITRL
jgi:hypothetical protein